MNFSHIQLLSFAWLTFHCYIWDLKATEHGENDCFLKYYCDYILCTSTGSSFTAVTASQLIQDLEWHCFMTRWSRCSLRRCQRRTARNKIKHALTEGLRQFDAILSFSSRYHIILSSADLGHQRRTAASDLLHDPDKRIIRYA